MSEIPTAFQLSSDEFKAKYGVPKPKITDENLIFHCQSGKRALKAVEEVQGLGFEKYVSSDFLYCFSNIKKKSVYNPAQFYHF